MSSSLVEEEKEPSEKTVNPKTDKMNPLEDVLDFMNPYTGTASVVTNCKHFSH
jgi:hypothetical protein